MTVTTFALLDAASHLHGYLLKQHWNGQALVGPDSGVRFNARLGRFIKSYLHFLPWSDNYVYMQAQGYWILANWLMADLLDNKKCKDLALVCSEYVLEAQRPEGCWEYPNPEWKGRIATVEGDFAALGLLESYERTRQESLLAGAKLWHRFLLDNVGFQGDDDLLAVNYFANAPKGMVPNNTTLTLLTLAKLADATKDDQHLAPFKGMIVWLGRVQLETGELPYVVESSDGKDRPHFLCYQYNAFEFLDLAAYYRLTGDQAIWPVMEKLASYLSTGVTESGAARFDCHREIPEVAYYTAAIAAALSQAAALQIGDFRPLADRAYKRVLSQQRPDGGMEFFSQRNYGRLTDQRSYPRNLAMILYHFLLELQVRADHVMSMTERHQEQETE